jgi:hypothetical protein
MIGKPLNILILQHATGVDPNTGLFTIADPDEKRAYKLDPVFFGGIRNSLRYKQIELTTYFEFRQQKVPHIMTYSYTYLPAGQTNNDFFSNQPAELENRWRQRGDEAAWQKVSTLSTGSVKNAMNTWLKSDAQLVDASYLRLKHVQLSYTLSDIFCRKRQLKAASVYVSAENMITITPFKGADPELQVPFSLPLQRTITFGLQVTL